MKKRRELGPSSLLLLCAMGLCGCSAQHSAAPPPQPQAKIVAVPPPASADFRAQPPPPGPGTQLVVPSPAVQTLPNGVRVFTLERPRGAVTAALVVRHGASDVPAGKSGLAALVARMLTESTKLRSSEDLADAVESLGTTLENDALRDSIRLSVQCLPDDLERALHLLAEAALQPAFLPKEFDRVKGEWLDGLRAQRQNPMRLASLAGLRALLGPELGAPVGGSLPDVEALKIGDLRDWHERWVTPRSTALVVVGPVSKERVLIAADRSLAPLAGRSEPPPRTDRTPPEPSGTRVWLIDRPKAVQTALFVAQGMPARASAGYEARQILNNVLGGLFTSRINHNLREKNGYTYGASSTLVAARDFGALTVMTSVQTEVTGAAVREILGELTAARGRAAARPVTPGEMERARADLVHGLGAHLETGQLLQLDLENLFVHDLSPRYYAEFSKQVASLGIADALREAERLTPDRLVIVAVGNRQLIEPALVEAGLPVAMAAPAWVD